MASEDEVRSFLDSFNTYAKVFDIYIVNRVENTQALLDLEISANDRKEIIMNLQTTDYFKGPSIDRDRPEFEVWEFGTIVKNREVYIKLTRRRENSSSICISFHPAKHQITYPYK